MSSKLASTFFEFFALPQSYEIDLDALEQAYRRVQASVHPDRFANAPQAQRRYAMQLASRANEGVRVLRDPLSRARYLCELHGVDVAAESNTAMAPDFLELQMGWREALDDILEHHDRERLQVLTAEIDNERLSLQATLQDRLREPADAAGAGDAVRRWMFVERIADELHRARKQIDKDT
ncbi:MAG: Fe-S protein assembly co-chaperone HscB [Burkholderiaceae bacterium]